MRGAPTRLVPVLAAAACVLTPSLTTAGGSGALAAATRHTVHPGVAVTFGGVTCAAGFALRQHRVVYLALPSSCGGIESGTRQDGCAEAESPIGVPARIGGARHHGILVYSSFSEMQLHGEHRARRCYLNDLALIRVDRRDRSRVTNRIPGVTPWRGISTRPPANGSTGTVGTNPATIGASHYGGWETDLTSTTALAAADVGLPTIVRHRLAGMLTVLPTGTAMKSPAQIYSVHRALRMLHHTRRFRHVRVLRHPLG